MKIIQLFLITFLSAQFCYAQGHFAVPDVNGIHYGPGANQYLDIHLAESNTPTPVYFDAHASGGNTNMPRSIVEALKAEGISVVAWESIQRIGLPSLTQQGWDDAELMFAWVKANAQTYNFDTTRFIIGGSSRGTVLSWKYGHRPDPNIKGLYMYNALPNRVWKDPDWWLPTEEIKVSSPRIFYVYQREPGSSEHPTDPDGHDPINGMKIMDLYTALGIGDRDTLVHSIGASGNSDRYQFLVEFTRSVLYELPTKASQALTFEALVDKDYGDSNFNLSAIGGASGNPVTFVSSNTSVATISGNTVTIVRAGTVNITASQAGNDIYNASPDIVQPLTIHKKTLVVTANDQNRAFGDSNPTFSLTYEGFVNGDNEVVLDNPPIATTNAIISSIPEAYSIIASGGQDDNYSFNYVNGTLTIVKAAQVINLNPLPMKTTIDPSFDLEAVTNANLAISYRSSNPAVGTISGNTVTIVGAGTTNITASQPGDGNYNPANEVVQTLKIIKADQVIAFEPLPAKSTEDPSFDLEAVASSNLTIIYTSSNTDVATISGNTVTLVGAGTTNITASQPGDDNYNPASNVMHILTINEVGVVKGISLRLYPNPISKILTIEGLSGVVRYVLVNIQSKELLSGQGQDTFQLDVSTLPIGVYTLRLENDGRTIVRKVFKK
ncbi:hypothetical protein BKI52_14245 [marine bacterium AO1-C]|nr:hypothetical protein BKI52_14245 [marine bacterium AO1-C]